MCSAVLSSAFWKFLPSVTEIYSSFPWGGRRGRAEASPKFPHSVPCGGFRTATLSPVPPLDPLVFNPGWLSQFTWEITSKSLILWPYPRPVQSESLYKSKEQSSGAESLSLYPGQAVPPSGQVFKLSVPPFSHGKKKGGRG